MAKGVGGWVLSRYQGERLILLVDETKLGQHLRVMMRYWQEAGLRDLKSDGWQWQTSRIWSPDHTAPVDWLVCPFIALSYPLPFPLSVGG